MLPCVKFNGKVGSRESAVSANKTFKWGLSHPMLLGLAGAGDMVRGRKRVSKPGSCSSFSSDQSFFNGLINILL